jgi:hypothetical protein
MSTVDVRKLIDTHGSPPLNRLLSANFGRKKSGKLGEKTHLVAKSS